MCGTLPIDVTRRSTSDGDRDTIPKSIQLITGRTGI